MNVLNRAQAFFIPDHVKSDEVLVYRYRLVLNAAILTSAFSFGYLFISLLINFRQGMILMILNVIGFLCLPLLMKTRVSIKLIGNLYIIIGATAVLILIYYSGGMHSPILPWLIAPPVLALLIVNRAYAIVWTIISLLGLVAITILESKGFDFPVAYDGSWLLSFSFLCTFGIVLIVVVIAMTFEGNITRAIMALGEKNSELADLNSELHAQKEEITLISEQLKALNEKKDNLMYIIAHDLKSPLANIQALIRLSQLEKPGGTSQPRDDRHDQRHCRTIAGSDPKTSQYRKLRTDRL